MLFLNDFSLGFLVSHAETNSLILWEEMFTYAADLIAWICFWYLPQSVRQLSFVFPFVQLSCFCKIIWKFMISIETRD